MTERVAAIGSKAIILEPMGRSENYPGFQIKTNNNNM